MRNNVAIRQEHNCNTWASNDTILCPAERMAARQIEKESFDPCAEITIKRAHEDYHSFGGEIPKEIGEGLKLPQNDTIYPIEAYKRFGNQGICDTCGHKCLNG